MKELLKLVLLIHLCYYTLGETHSPACVLWVWDLNSIPFYTGAIVMTSISWKCTWVQCWSQSSLKWNEYRVYHLEVHISWTCDVSHNACDINDSLACLSSSACPAGSFGDGCRGVCGCRDVSECDTITGHCTCQPGYTGTTCHDECPEGFYGQNCSSECDCSSNGTVSCNNLNGTCNCRDNWMGDHCEIESMYVCNIAYWIFIP